MMTNRVYLTDCMDYMAGLDDKAFDLAIVDPPYGIFKQEATGFKKRAIYDAEGARIRSWDKRPEADYFRELERVSKNRIIWGAQYFAADLPDFSQLIIWDKGTGKNYFADGEAAYCSIKGTLRIFRHKWVGAVKASENGEAAIHPTQKPIALYRWLLQRYASPGDRILDTHIGSGSIRLACHDLGFHLEGCEADPKHYQDQEGRYQRYVSQAELFQGEDLQAAILEGGDPHPGLFQDLEAAG